MFALLVGPVEEAGDYLEDLEFLGVGAVEGEELEEVVGYDLSVGEGHVSWVGVGIGEGEREPREKRGGKGQSKHTGR